MKLSELVFECVKDSISLPNTYFNYHSFLDGSYDNNKDYMNQIAGVFNALNLALSRLYDEDKIPYFTTKVALEGNEITFEDGEIINIVKIQNDGYKRFEFRSLNENKYLVIGDNVANQTVYIEYKKPLPHFTEKDLKTTVLDEDNELNVIDSNIELSSYGISNNMCSYIKEFVKGQLMEIYDPTLSNLHNNRAEQYFQAIKQASTSFYQSRVINRMRGVL